MASLVYDSNVFLSAANNVGIYCRCVTVYDVVWRSSVSSRVGRSRSLIRYDRFRRNRINSATRCLLGAHRPARRPGKGRYGR